MSDLPQAARRDLVELYRRVDDELERSRPRCELSGRCCDFPTSGLALYATTLEVRHAVQSAASRPPAGDPERCPWHVGGLCTHRDGRPLGCRLYFCDPSWEPRMPAVYERYHAELKALHVRHGLPYEYGPFPQAVAGHSARVEP